VGISAPPAGSAPSGKPIAEPRSHGFHERRKSSRVIIARPRTGTISSSVFRRWRERRRWRDWRRWRGWLRGR